MRFWAFLRRQLYKSLFCLGLCNCWPQYMAMFLMWFHIYCSTNLFCTTHFLNKRVMFCNNTTATAWLMPGLLMNQLHFKGVIVNSREPTCNWPKDWFMFPWQPEEKIGMWMPGQTKKGSKYPRLSFVLQLNKAYSMADSLPRWRKGIRHG